MLGEVLKTTLEEKGEEVATSMGGWLFNTALCFKTVLEQRGFDQRSDTPTNGCPGRGTARERKNLGF